jgi:hypothetical protein
VTASAPVARRPADPVRRWQAAANSATGEAAEVAWMAELTRAGVTFVWRRAANTSARWNADTGGFDVLSISGDDVTLSQVKATAREPWPPPPIWRTRFLGMPHPPGLRYLLVWLTPEGTWRVWRLLGDGTRLAAPWPPAPSREEGP